MLLPLSLFSALAFAIVIAIFAVQNTTTVAVSFLGWRSDNVAVSVLVLLSAALGAGVMLLLATAREVSLRFRQRSLTQSLRRAERRIAELEAAAATPVLTEGEPSTEPIPAAEPSVTFERPTE